LPRKLSQRFFIELRSGEYASQNIVSTILQVSKFFVDIEIVLLCCSVEIILCIFVHQ